MTGTKYGTQVTRVGLCTFLPILFAGLSACTTTTAENGKAEINTKTKFASADFGVKASPRVTTKKTVRPGGGHFQVGKPYKVAGKWYHPKMDKKYDKVGMASWYGPNFHGRLTANGEIYDQYNLTAASTTLPLPSYARVTNENTGDSVIVRVNDRGPFAHNRIIDLSNAAAKMLHMRVAGTAKVRVKYVGLAPVDGDDSSYLLASYQPGGDEAPASQTGKSGVMVATNDASESGLPGVKMTDDDIASAGGTAPSSGVAAVPATAMMSNRAASPAQKSIEAVLVPDVAPVPTERPASKTASAEDRPTENEVVNAYASRPGHATPRVFNNVLADNTLTGASIVRAWNVGAIAQN